MKRKPPRPKIVWREGYFIARTDFGKRKTDAMVHGPFAIHKDFRWGREWVVSSVSTGLIIWTFHLDHEDEPYKCAETLLKYARKEFMMDHPKLLRRKLPTWIIKWIYGVKRYGGWLPTKKYREKYGDEREERETDVSDRPNHPRNKIKKGSHSGKNRSR